MPSTGIRKASSTDKRATDARIENHKDYIESLKPFGSASIAGLGNSGGSGEGGGNGGGNYVLKAGDIMNGILSFRPVAILMSNDTIDLTDPDNQSNRIIVTGELAANDDVKFVKLASPVPAIPFLIQGVIGISLTFKNQDPSPPDALHRKIRTFDGSDFVLTGNQNVWAVYDSALDEVALLTAGSGGGITDPLILNSVDHGTIGLVSENIDLSENGGNTHFMTLSGDVTFGFTSPPVSGKMERFILHIKMDQFGGHIVTWPASFLSPPTIDTTPNAINKVEIYTFDGGMTYHALTVVSGGGGASNLWGNIVIDIPSKDMMASNLEKLGDITFSEIGQSILTDPIGLFYTVPIGQEHIFSLAGTPRLTVGNDSILAGTILNMADNKINQAQHITFSGNETLNLVTEAGVGFDNLSNFQIYNVPLTNQSHVFAAAGELLGSISRIGASSGQLTIDNVVAGDLLQTNGQLFLSTVATPSPLFDGAIWRDTSGIFKARQNGVTENLISNDASLWSTFPATTDVDLTTNTVTILGGGAGEGMTNTGHIDFVDNLATPVAPLSIYSDGIDLFANTGGGVVNLSDIGDNEFFGPWTANHDAGTKSLVNLGLAQYVDTGGVPRGTISGDSGASAIRLATASGGKFIISDVITDIAEFTDAVGLKMLGTHGINMNKNVINTIGSTEYDRTVGFSPTVANTIGFDTTVNFLKYNVGLTSDAHAWYAAGELLANISRVAANSGQLSIDNVVSNLLQADEQLFFTDSTTDPTINGQIRRNGNTIKAFVNGGVVDLADIGSGGGGATNLDDLTDVTLIAETAGQYLRFGGTVWSNSQILWPDINLTGSSLDDLGDVLIGTPAANTVLKWSGSNWVDGNIVNANIDAGAAIDISKLDITGTPDGTKFLRDDGSWQNIVSGTTDKISEGDSSIEIIDTLGPGGSAQFIMDGVPQGNITNALGWVFDTNATFGGTGNNNKFCRHTSGFSK